MNFRKWYATHHQRHILVKDLEYCWDSAKRDLLTDIAPFIKHDTSENHCEACKIINMHTTKGETK